MEIEHAFICPHCWQTITMLLDVTVARQQYIEDCEVCCNPIQIRYTTAQGQLINFAAESLEQ